MYMHTSNIIGAGEGHHMYNIIDGNKPYWTIISFPYDINNQIF